MTYKSFSEFLYDNHYPLNYTKGQLINGIIVNTSKDIIFVDIGLKKNVKFKKSEIYSTFLNSGYSFEIGQIIPLYLENYDYYEGNLILSYEKGQKLLKEKFIWDSLEEKKYVNGRILNYVNGGYSVGIGGLVAFLPKNHLGDLKEKLMGQLKTFSILKMNKANNNVIVSRLSALEAWKTKRSAVAHRRNSKKL